MPMPAVRIIVPYSTSVSRIAGASLRCIRSFITLRGTSLWYHSAAASPVSTARRPSGPKRS
jgi:hypothetical protein